MARIETKNCNLYIVDGTTSENGAVNNGSGYAAGIATMLIDGITGIIPKTMLFRVVGCKKLHRVTATLETTGNTTSITFTPALSAAVLDNAVITWYGLSVAVTLGEGNITYSRKTPRIYDTDRGSLDTVRDDVAEPLEVNVDSVYTFIRTITASDPSVSEALYGEGNAATAGWVTSAADACEPYAVDLVLEHVPPCGSTATEVTTFPDFRVESEDIDLNEATISIQGKCNAVKPTITRHDGT